MLTCLFALMQAVRADVRISADADGQVSILHNGETLQVNSSFSYPADTIGWNALGQDLKSSEPQWQPSTKKITESELEITAATPHYSIVRRVSVQGHIARIEDVLTNPDKEPVEVIVLNGISASGPVSDVVISQEIPENPTIFAKSPGNSFGIVVEDAVSRHRFSPSVKADQGKAVFEVGDIAVDGGKSIKLVWLIDLLDDEATYFDFINDIRDLWKSNYPINGPVMFFDLSYHAALLEDADALKAFLARRKIGVAAITPFLDYEPSGFSYIFDHDEYKRRMIEALANLKKADPSIKVLGCIETDFSTIYPDQIPDGSILVPALTEDRWMTAEQTAVVERADLPWRDSVKRDPDGLIGLERYQRAGKTFFALAVYPAIGNHQHDFMMKQAQFILEEVKLDGLYIDDFNQGGRSDAWYDYSGWDGVSAKVDRKTGKITRKFIDCGIAGAGHRVKIVEYATNQGKTVLTNGYATTLAEQSIPAIRFDEMFSRFDPMTTPDGQMPPLNIYMMKSLLTTPVGLGTDGNRDRGSARQVMKAVVTYLRHGMLYAHYGIGPIPQEGEGSGTYEPINRMFPITPVRLGEGYIVGNERVVACISREFDRPLGSQPPQVFIYDLDGREVSHDVQPHKNADGTGWRIDLKLEDWKNIAIIE